MNFLRRLEVNNFVVIVYEIGIYQLRGQTTITHKDRCRVVNYTNVHN